MNDQIGCFGSVLYHDAASRRCSNCPQLSECKIETAANKEKLDQWFASLTDDNKKRKRGERGVQAISAPIATPRAAASTTETKPLIETGKSLNKKPKEFVERWCKKGIPFDQYREGKNPFKTCGNKFAAVAMDYFLEHKEVDSSDLNDEFQAKCGWQAGTAASHVNIIYDAFEYLGIITVHGKKAYLRT